VGTLPRLPSFYLDHLELRKFFFTHFAHHSHDEKVLAMLINYDGKLLYSQNWYPEHRVKVNGREIMV
jgi:hypothetical protein